MASTRTQYREVFAPRTVTKARFKALVEELAVFKTGLPTVSRRLRARAISAGKVTDLEGPESWKVIDPHSLAELEHVRVELLLAAVERRSCELHIEFRSGHILLNVSDTDTEWGRSVFEDTRTLLRNLGIFPKRIYERLRKAYGLLDIFQNVLLMASAAVFTVWLVGMGTRFLYASLALFVAGVMPAMTRSYHFFASPRRTLVIGETVGGGGNVPWAEATAVLSFIAGALQLARQLIAIAW